MIQISVNPRIKPWFLMGLWNIFRGWEYLNHLKLSELGKKCFFFSWVPQGCLVELCNERIGCDIFSAGISALSVKWRPIGVKWWLAVHGSEQRVFLWYDSLFKLNPFFGEYFSGLRFPLHLGCKIQPPWQSAARNKSGQQAPLLHPGRPGNWPGLCAGAACEGWLLLRA